MFHSFHSFCFVLVCGCCCCCGVSIRLGPLFSFLLFCFVFCGRSKVQRCGADGCRMHFHPWCMSHHSGLVSQNTSNRHTYTRSTRDRNCHTQLADISFDEILGLPAERFCLPSDYEIPIVSFILERLLERGSVAPAAPAAANDSNSSNIGSCYTTTRKRKRASCEVKVG